MGGVTRKGETAGESQGLADRPSTAIACPRRALQGVFCVSGCNKFPVILMINSKLTAAVAVGTALCVGWIGLYFLTRKEKKKKAIGIVVACTGFGKFRGVSDNPTEIIIKKLPVFLKTNPLDDHRIFIDRCKVLEVSGLDKLSTD